MSEKAYTSLEDQYQTVNVRRTREEITTTNTVEEILKKIVPAKSFLYRNHQDKKNDRIFSSYLPMDSGTPKKPRRFFRMSSYEYPIFSSKLTKTEENHNDRGYYSVKTNSRYYIQKTFRIPEAKTKYKSITNPEDVSESIVEDHLYEDLCYTDVEKQKTNEEYKDQIQKPYKIKIQELFQSIKLPFFKKNEEADGKEDAKEIVEVVSEEKKAEGNFYENGDVEVAANMYDSVHAVRPVEGAVKDRVQIPVEDYLEPIQVERDHQYCDVALKEDSLLQYIMNLFENFGMRRETNEETSEDLEPRKTEEPPEWTNMASRPLPVPVENEPYYMQVTRSEAEDLLRGEPDGVFILRPSSQPTHAYTLSVSCAGGVHNVGVRRRNDGRLALGYARRGERSFTSIASLLRHHKRRRLLLVAGGGVVGATTLNEPPRYYQTPSSIPVPVRAQ